MTVETQDCERRLLGELLPDRQGRSDRQFPSDPAIGNIIRRARSWGPKLPVVIQAWGDLTILGQVTLGEQQAVSPQLLEPLCCILVEGGKRRAAQAGPLKRDDSIGEVTALVQ